MPKTINERLQKAAQAFDKKDFLKAEKQYRKALKASPKNLGASIGLVMVLNRSERAEDALNMLQPIWERVEDSVDVLATSKASILVELGIAQQQLNMRKGALKSFQAAYALSPTEALKNGIAKLQAPSKPASEPIQNLISQAAEQRREGALVASVRLYEAALQINADSPEALHGLGLTLREMGQTDKALAVTQQAIILAPDHADFYNDLGVLFQDRNDFKKAVTFHKRAISYDADFVAAWINLGVAFKRSGNDDEAIKMYQKAISINPNIPEAYNNLGNLLKNQGRLNEASVALAKAIKLRPDYADAIRNLEDLNSMSSDV